ncbi:MAG: hypothetical protein AVDCRST_MAG85-1652, partial [uncultured Solirubrobacteraceae bacterium]
VAASEGRRPVHPARRASRLGGGTWAPGAFRRPSPGRCRPAADAPPRTRLARRPAPARM